MNTFSQPVLLAVSQMKEFEKFIQSPLEACILMNLHIRLLPDVVRAAHGAGKTVFVHADLIHGLAADEYGCEYICQQLGADGVISTKPKVLETARRSRRAAILRLFLIDSQSLSKGIALIRHLRPDYVELLPALACEVIPELLAGLAQHLSGQDEGSAPDISLLCGGLIRTPSQIDRCLRCGARAVTLSDQELAIRYLTSGQRR